MPCPPPPLGPASDDAANAAPALPDRQQWLDPFPDPRLRSHLGSDLVDGTPKAWFGPVRPPFVPASDAQGLALVLLDAGPDGWFALYRELYRTDAPLDWRNQRYRARFHDPDGKIAWDVDLGGHFSRPDHLEVQDARFAGGVLYFNEACQTYSAEAGGLCSSLVALDPAGGRVLWRTPPLVSNGRVAPIEPGGARYLVTGYGFTDEPDFVSLVRRDDGRVVARARLAGAPENYAVDGDTLRVHTARGEETFRLDALDTSEPKLVPLSR
ncbi:MAG: hypothetical protein AABZ30_06235 [Myxococcota bacterium]